MLFRIPVLSTAYRPGNARGGECGEIEARGRGVGGRLPSEGCCYQGMREEREESNERARRVGKRSRLPVSIDPPRRSRAHLVFHPTSSSVVLSLYREREREEEEEEEEKERARYRQKENRHMPADTSPENAATQNATSALCIPPHLVLLVCLKSRTLSSLGCHCIDISN